MYPYTKTSTIRAYTATTQRALKHNRRRGAADCGLVEAVFRHLTVSRDWHGNQSLEAEEDALQAMDLVEALVEGREDQAARIIENQVSKHNAHT